MLFFYSSVHIQLLSTQQTPALQDEYDENNKKPIVKFQTHKTKMKTMMMSFKCKYRAKLVSVWCYRR